MDSVAATRVGRLAMLRIVRSALSVSGAFALVVVLHIALQIDERGLDATDELMAARRKAPHVHDGVAFRIIVSDGEGLAVVLEAEGRAFDDLIGGLPIARKEDFNFRRRASFVRPPCGRGRPVPRASE